MAAICGVEAETIEALAREYSTQKPAAIRLNFGMQRHGGGGMAVRTFACLPAITGAWRSPHGGLLFFAHESYPLNLNALQRPELSPPGTRTINMIQLGSALTELNDPPVKALFVYNSNPASIAPDQERVRAGLQREDLFTVVLEQEDLHIGYGHLYVMWNAAAIARPGEAVPNTELFRRLAARMGMTEPCFQDSDEEMARQVLDSAHPWLEGITLESVKAAGSLRLNVPKPFAPFAEGHFPTASGKCELYSERMAKEGYDPLPTWTPPLECSATTPELYARYPRTLISPHGHYVINSTFGNVL